MFGGLESLSRSAGMITKRNLGIEGPLCLKPVAVFDAARIRALRERFKLSQTVLAAVLNTSPSTVRKWEGGDKCPSGPSLKLLDLLDRKGLDAVL
jgi:putative transcriptional regulator